MPRSQGSRYPSHLARLVAARLRERDIDPPPDNVLLRLLETMYFASLKTDEHRPCRCTVNCFDSRTKQDTNAGAIRAGATWTTIRFRQPIPLTIDSLTKLADAADPTVSSLAVSYGDNGELFIWGMVDQELHSGDQVALDPNADLERPGHFQATITDVGSVSVYKNYALLGSLEQNNLIASFHDVLWEGPVHRRLTPLHIANEPFHVLSP